MSETLNPSVRICQALESVVYIKDFAPSIIHCHYIHEDELQNLTKPYLAIIPQQMNIAGPGGALATQTTLDVTCGVTLQFVQRLDSVTTEAIDDMLQWVWLNMQRVRVAELPGIEASFIQNSLRQEFAYSEPRLRELHVFDSRFSAAWRVAVDSGVLA